VHCKDPRLFDHLVRDQQKVASYRQAKRFSRFEVDNELELQLPVIAYAFLVYMLSPLPRRSDWGVLFRSFTLPYQPSPITLSGRPPHALRCRTLTEK
jgi:hypothetical protein